MCDFEQDKNDKFIWTRRKGAGASNYTEPTFDHTTGSTTGEPYNTNNTTNATVKIRQTKRIVI